MKNQKRVRRRLAALVGLAVVLVSLIPQVSLWIARGRDWKGAYAFTDPDELAYSAYLNSLISGRPRRNNPYLGVHDSSVVRGETLFSVQFFPPYLLSRFGQAFGLSASTIFILIIPMAALLAALSIFWLIEVVTEHNGVAAVGVLIVLFCGLLVSESPLAAVQSYGTIAFLRRYIPAVPFPLFILFCLSVWRALYVENKGRLSVVPVAGVLFASLVYCYFYLWTAAAAWLFCFTLLWILARPPDRLHVLKCVALIGGLAALP